MLKFFNSVFYNICICIFFQINRNFPDAIINKCHTGQYFEIADAKLEFYYTPDDFILKDRNFLTDNNFNNSSIIFSVNIGGQRIMFLGDAQPITNDLTAGVFGSYLKSDFVQIAHHGGYGGTNKIYDAIDAQIALMTTDDSRVNSFINKYKANYHLLYELNVIEWYNVHNRVYVFELPYTPTGSGWIVDPEHTKK